MSLDINSSPEMKNYFQNDSNDWYMNYAVGVPEFANHFQQELLNFKTYWDQNMLNSVCLTVAVYNNSKDLAHDISQTMFNHNFEFSRDEAMGVICETMSDYFNGEYVIGTNHQEGAIRMTLALLKNIPETNFKDWENTKPYNQDVRKMIGIADVISKIV